ncbi:ROK family transcriptional regulator [Cellulomonas aerilata]|uniref:Sugar kinase n=1 Tax=Cellulomonas aerilata TaxID=515326 RepID=A0A512DCK4_9CELL|nr:ROK family protein [Cellulomonas aerilata]GEO34209.1 sugar kinase [Cellulomonas aerilata]
MPSGPGDVFELIRHGRARTRGDLLGLTGLSRMTVAQRVDVLLAAGLIREAGSERASGGRRPARLELDVTHSVVISATVDTTHSRTALTDLSGRILADRQLDVAVEDGPEAVLSGIAGAARDLLDGQGLPAARVSGFGISVPGPVDPATLRPSQPPIMPGWDAYPVAEHLHDGFGVPVLVENDANAMALGEYSSGYLDCRALCLVKVSTGIGTGIVIDGRVYQGIDGGAGDIGHVRLSGHDDAVCQCGARGCLAAVASGRAVAQALTAEGIPAASGRDVRALLSRGDVAATRRTQEAGRVIGGVMATVVCLVNPGVLLVGGALASSALISGVRETLYPRSLPRATRHLEVRLASLGEDAGIVGMTRMVVDQVFAPRAVDAMLGA